MTKVIDAAEIQITIKKSERTRIDTGSLLHNLLATKEEWDAAERSPLIFVELLRKIVDRETVHATERNVVRRKRSKRNRKSVLSKCLGESLSHLEQLSQRLNAMGIPDDVAGQIVMAAFKSGRDLALGLMHSVEPAIRAHARNTHHLREPTKIDEDFEERRERARSAMIQYARLNPGLTKTQVIRDTARLGVRCHTRAGREHHSERTLWSYSKGLSFPRNRAPYVR